MAVPARNDFKINELCKNLRPLAKWVPLSAGQNSDPTWWSLRPKQGGNPRNHANDAQSLPSRQEKAFPLNTYKSNG